MKKYLLAMLAIVGLLFVSSCTNDEIDDATLTLSETVVKLGKGVGEKTVIVTTDQEKWSAIGSAGWVEISQSDDQLTIKVAENTSVEARTARVLVVAGNTNAFVDVTQAGGSGSTVVDPNKVIVDPDNIEVTQYGGEKIVDVSANEGTWEASTEADWIILKEKPYKSELVITVKENTERASRVGKVFLTIGEVNKEIKVTQSGILFYLTPYLEMGALISPIMQFELARRSINVNAPDGTFKPAYWDFVTESPLFTKIRYVFPNNNYKEALVLAADKELFKAEIEGFKSYLLEQGWTKENEFVFFYEKYSIRATIAPPDAETSFVQYKYVTRQDKDYPTFKAFPYGYLGWGNDKSAIDSYEAENAGKYNADKSNIGPWKPHDYLFYDVDDEAIFGRAYFVKHKTDKNPGLAQTAQYFLNMNLVFYEDKGDVYFTKEFLALCEKEGFIYDENFPLWHRFVNDAKSLECLIRWVKYDEFDKPIIDIHMSSTASNSSVSIYKTPDYLKYDMPKQEEAKITGLRDIIE